MTIESVMQEVRSRSSWVGQDCSSAAMAADGLSQSCWANLPQELLREVLLRIEASESEWPLRKRVVACAGVCLPVLEIAY